MTLTTQQEARMSSRHQGARLKHKPPQVMDTHKGRKTFLGDGNISP